MPVKARPRPKTPARTATKAAPKKPAKAPQPKPARGVIRLKSDVAFFELEIRIAAPPDRVWSALTNDIADWWLPDFHCAPGSTAVRLEAWPGGRLYEEAEDGGGLVWFNVVALTPPKTLHLAGHIIPPYGGPATTLLYLSLDRTAAGTLLKVHNSVLGYFSKAQLANTIDGWRQLFAEGLKTFVEQGAPVEAGAPA